MLKQLVEKPLQELTSVIQSHLSAELGTDMLVASADEDSEDIRASSEIVHCMYQNSDIFEILLTTSQGSAYEGIVSRFADSGRI